MLPQAPEDGEGGRWSEIRRIAELAEDGGADSLWVCDHFLDRRPDREVGYHEPFTLLAAIASCTSVVELGTLVASGSFRSPGLLAKMAATLDEVSNGRLVLGLGCGWHEPEYQAFGYPFDHRVGRFEEVLRAVRGLLDGERVTMLGRWTGLDDAVLLPAPRRRIPIVVAAEGARMLSLMAEHADGWQTAWHGLPDAAFASATVRLDLACTVAGRRERPTVHAGIEVTADPSAEPALRLDPEIIAHGLEAWESVGVDHVQLGVRPSTRTTFAAVLDGVSRYRML